MKRQYVLLLVTALLISASSSVTAMCVYNRTSHWMDANFKCPTNATRWFCSNKFKLSPNGGSGCRNGVPGEISASYTPPDSGGFGSACSSHVNAHGYIELRWDGSKLHCDRFD